MSFWYCLFFFYFCQFFKCISLQPGKLLNGKINQNQFHSPIFSQIGLWCDRLGGTCGKRMRESMSCWPCSSGQQKLVVIAVLTCFRSLTLMYQNTNKEAWHEYPCTSSLCFFLWLTNIPVQRYFRFCLSMHPLLDNWIVSALVYYKWCYYKCSGMFLCEHIQGGNPSNWIYL